MSVQFFGFYFSGNADASANDKTVYVEMTSTGTMKLSARYKNSDPNHLYEIEFDADDLRTFGGMCVDLANRMPRLA